MKLVSFVCGLTAAAATSGRSKKENIWSETRDVFFALRACVRALCFMMKKGKTLWQEDLFQPSILGLVTRRSLALISADLASANFIAEQCWG